MSVSPHIFSDHRTAKKRLSFSLLLGLAAAGVLIAPHLSALATGSTSTVAALSSNITRMESPPVTPVWRFKSTSLSANWPSAQIVSEPRVDTRGGEVIVSMRGLELYYCPRRGVEKVRFNWEFNRDVSILRPGEDLEINLHVEPVTRDNYCTGQLEANSSTEGLDSNNAGYSKEETLFNSSAFFTKRDGRAQGGDRTPSRRNATVVLTVDPDPVRFLHLDRKMGRFTMRVSGPCDDPVPYGCGWFLFQYNYDLDVTGTGSGNTGGGNTGGGGNTNACGFSIGSGIYDKWKQTGGEGGTLGCARSNEAEAGRSPMGTTGRYALFSGWANAGVIIWHANGRFAGRAFAVYGAIGQLYQSLGGTNSWLGFPISDEHTVPGGRRSDFQGGYIFWDEKTGRTKAVKYPIADYEKGPSGSSGFKRENNMG